MKRTKIGSQWYSFKIPQGTAGIRAHSRGSWGFYFRASPRRVPNGIIGQLEYFANSYAAALRAVNTFAATGKLP